MVKKMKNQDRTTVRFEKCMKTVADYLAAVYGLKNLVSAGVYMFAKLPDSEQKKMIADMKNIPKEISATVDEILAAYESAIDDSKSQKLTASKSAKSAG